jgi:hypothetical protein
MPSTIVKLSSSDARAWTHNQPVWLDPNGEVDRPVTREEQHAISKALERSVRIKQSFRAKLPLLALNSTGRRTVSRTRAKVEELDTAFEVTYVGEKRVVTVWNGDRRYATGREVLSARLLADHGECVLHGRNGKCIGVLRDPFINQREPQLGSRVQWSRNPTDPRRSEAERSELTRERDEQRVAPVRRRKRAAIVRKGKSLYAPQNCPNDCRGRRGGQAWKLSPSATPPTDDEHHPLCAHAATWAATLDRPQTTEVLYDLETSEVKRPAVPDEIAEADANEARTGLRQVSVAGRVFAVLSPEDAERAQNEARGESDDEEEVTDAESDGDTLDAAGSGEAPLALVPPVSEKRDGWPTLDELSPRGRLNPVSEITVRDYLARSPESGRAP